MSDEPLPPINQYPRAEKTSGPVHGAMVAAEVAASFLPGVSYSAQQLLDHYVRRPLEERRETWLDQLGERVMRLEGRPGGFDPRTLDRNEEFISVVFEATQIAMKTHVEEKREALQNAVLNTALGDTLDEVLRGSFMDYIARFSPLHIKVLRLLQDPQKSPEMYARAANMMAGGMRGLLETALPKEALGEPPDRVLHDLNAANLHFGNSLNALSSSDGLLQKRTTPTGDAFLKFISAPV